MTRRDPRVQPEKGDLLLLDLTSGNAARYLSLREVVDTYVDMSHQTRIRYMIVEGVVCNVFYDTWIRDTKDAVILHQTP